MPFANWEHPCSYIFVDKQTGEHEIVKEKIHPANFNEYEIISKVKRPGGACKMLKSNSPAVIQTVTPNEHLYAVIINGCDWRRYWNDISAMYCTLVDVYGYPEENIFVHYVGGSSSFGNDFNDDSNSDIDYNANKGTIERTFRNLSGEWTNDPNVPELGPNDQLFIFTDDHGGHDGSSYLCLPDYDLYPNELADYVEDINCASMVFVMEQCHSGGFESDITDVTNAACKHRVIHTACGEYESSWAEIWIGDAMYDEFVFYWTAAARGYYPDPTGAEPWETIDATGSFDFDSYFVSHPADYDPDDNSDGKVQMEEAFAYADDFDTWSPTGYYNRYYSYDENPITNNISGFQEDLLDLSGYSGTISNNQTVSGSFIVSGDLLVPSGVTLNISAGSKFYFINNGSELIVNGTLSAVGTSGNNITFDFTSPSANGIEFNNGSSGTLSYCTIENAYCGVDCNQSLPTITNCTISNNYTGIELYNIGVQTNNIGNNTIEDNQYYGINMTYSSPRNIYGNTIDDNGQAGIYCANYSTPYIYNNTITNNGAAGITFAVLSPGHLGDYSGSGGYNLITGNYWGVGCGYESDAIIGTTSAAGYNSIHDNTSYEVTGEYDSHVIAENNWWNRTPPTYPNYYYSGDFITSNGGTVDYIPALTSSPLGGLKITVSSGSVESDIELSKELGTDSFIDSELRDALNNLLEGKYEEANTKYIQRFNKETDQSKKKYILRRIADCYNLSGKKGFADFLNNEVRLGISKKDELYALTLALENMFLIGEKKYEQAVNNFEILKKDFSDNEAIVKPALYNLICLNYNQLNDANKAKEYYAELKAKYPDDELTIHSMILFGEIDGYVPREVVDKKEITGNKDEVLEYSLFDNYPNPFNPTTKISFSIPNSGHVTLKVFDILGREVIVLVNKVFEAGKYEVEFNASHLPSGVYISYLTTGNKTLTSKMLLLK